MNCPNCKNVTRVIETREDEKGLKRRRKCLACKERFNSYERHESVGTVTITAERMTQLNNAALLLDKLQQVIAEGIRK